MNIKKIEQLAMMSKKGKKIIILGASGEGKSTLLNSMGCEEVSEILENREAHGKGSLITTEVTITNNNLLEKGNVAIFMKYASYVEMQSFDLESDVLKDAVYAAVSNVSKYQDKNKGKNISIDKCLDEYRSEISKVVEYNVTTANKKNNSSLAHKINLLMEQNKNDADEIINELKTIIQEIDISIVLKIYENCKCEVGNNKKQGNRNNRIRKLFLADFFKEVDSNDKIKLVYDKYIETCKKLFDKLKENGLERLRKCGEDKFIEFEKDSASDWDCAVILNSQTPKECIDQLLNSEDKSIEFLFSNLKLVYRSDEDIVDKNIKSLDGLIVSKDINENLILNNNYYDTQGLFHNKEEKIDDAYERALDIISQQGTDTVVFVLSACENVNTKDSLNVLVKLIENSNKDLKVYIMLSKVDELLINTNSSTSRKKRIKTDENEIKTKFKETLQKRVDEIQSSINNGRNNNTHKHKPRLMGIYPYGLYQNVDGSIIDQFIEENQYDVQKGILNFMKDISSVEKQCKIQINVSNDIDEVKIEIGNRKQIENEIINLFNNKFISGSFDDIKNNVSELTKKRAMGQSAGAAIRKGLIGENHESDINMEIWKGRYDNIKVLFPVKMKHLVVTTITQSIYDDIINNMYLEDNSEFKIEDKDKFYNLLKERIKSQYYMGKNFSGTVFKKYYIASCYYLKADILNDIVCKMYNDFFALSSGNSNLSVFAKIYLDVVLEIANSILDENAVYVYKY